MPRRPAPRKSAQRKSAQSKSAQAKSAQGKSAQGKSAKPRAPRSRTARVLPTLTQRQRGYQWLRTTPATLQLLVLFALCGGFWLALNWAYQVARKPSELWFPVSGAFYKTPAETWDQYSTVFRRHSTPLITPEFLAALAQIEGSGNPVARTYWRWSFGSKPFDVYRPASSAVGMYQITDGTFAEARRYCIHDHRVVADGPWDDWNSCWFTSLYTRVIPSHAVELTAAYLDQRVQEIVARRHLNPRLSQAQDLAAVIHLCGAGAGASYAARGFRVSNAQRCGDHTVRVYLSRVNAMQQRFAALAARDTRS
jgi:hypothetical protein